MMQKTPVSAYCLLLINIVIIIAAEFVNDGKLFFESGFIHGIALLFIISVAIVLSRQYYLADPILKKFINACLIAFVVFSASHIIEFLGYQFFGAYGDHLFALALNFYLISLLVMISGSEIFLLAYGGYHDSRRTLLYTNIAIGAFILLSTLLFVNTSWISLEPNMFAPYLYVLILLSVAVLLERRIFALRKALVQLTPFFSLLRLMVVFVAVASCFYALYEVIQDYLGVPEYQIIYLSHFFFYGGMSLMFVAFQRLSSFGGGLIGDIKALKKS